jgi:hypothetical protein
MPTKETGMLIDLRILDDNLRHDDGSRCRVGTMSRIKPKRRNRQNDWR